MSSPEAPSAHEVIIESLGRLSEKEREKLLGSGWVSFATRKLRSLRKQKKWVYALSATMGLFAIAVPTTAFFHYYRTVESFSILGFLSLIAGACAFAGAQMGGAVYTYLNWRHRLRCYKSLRALGRETEVEKTESAAPAS